MHAGKRSRACKPLDRPVSGYVSLDGLVEFLAARYAEDWGTARDRELAEGLVESRATRDVDAKREMLTAYIKIEADGYREEWAPSLAWPVPPNSTA